MKRYVIVGFLACLAVAGTALAQSLPFPQHVTYAAGIKPNNVTQAAMDSTVSSYWSTWSSRYLKSASTGGYYVAYNLEGQGSTGASTVSEAHGYGMVLCAYMGDKTHFDGMYTYYKNHPSQNNAFLMAWQQDTSFNNMGGADSATDGDMDIAFSLLLADKQWGSAGTINYLQAAVNMINAIMQSDVNQTTWTLRLGDWATSGTSQGYASATATRPSDFMFDHLQSFLTATGDTRWTNVINATNNVVNTLFASSSPNTGLIPDFVVYNGSTYLPAPASFLEGATDGEYAYNSCRTPWRFATDYLLRGNSGILAAMRKTNTWIQSASSGSANSVWPGYTLAGTALTTSYTDSAFTSPFAVGAMIDAANQTWLNSLWTWIAARGITATDGYFGNSITLQCALVLSGNWWSPTAATTTQYSITASAGANGAISPSGSVAVTAGANRTFSITANSGYQVSAVTVDGTSVGAVASYTFSNVQANHTISATFAASTSTTTAVNDNALGITYTGTWTYSSNRSTGDYQSDVHYTKTNGDSFSDTFTGTGIDYVTETNSDEGQVGIYIDGVLQTTISCTSTTRAVQQVVYSVAGLTPGTHTFKAVKVSGTYMLLDELIVHQSTSTTTYTITASAGANGAVSPSGTVTVNQGANQAFTLTPNAGYAVSAVTVDGSSVGAVTTYTFSNVQANHTLTATFAASGTDTNLAPSGTAYGWKANTSATANTNKTALPGLNDNNVTTNVDLNSAGDAANAWEAAGVTWTSAKTITSANFTNGDITSGGDGFLTASLQLQFSTDGTTWTNSGWTVSPTYPYSSAAGGVKYTFSGTAVSNVRGARVVGQVRTADTSYHWIVKEVQFIGH